MILSEVDTPDTSQELNLYLEKKARLSSAGQLKWFHWVIIFSSMFATLFAWNIAQNNSIQQMENLYEREVHQVTDRITERMRHYEDALRGGVATLTASDTPLSDENWRRYSQSLDLEQRYPGINGLGVIDVVERSDIDEYLKKQRLERPDFRMFPPHDNVELWPIAYIEPLQTNAAALGLDVAHESNRLNAAMAARRTGKAQITGPITLVQDARKTPGFLFYAPQYSKGDWKTDTEREENFVNLVYAPFVFERLMHGTLNFERRLVSLRIKDQDKILYEEISESGLHSSLVPTLQSQKIIDMYGRQWVFDIETNKAFDLATKNNKPLFILISGLAIELLIIALFTALTRANRRAVKFADDMANAYRENSNLLTNITDNATDCIILSDLDSRIQRINKASATIFGRTPEELIGEDMKLLFPDLYSDYLKFNSDAVKKPSGKAMKEYFVGNTREVTSHHKNGEKIILEISISEIEENGNRLYNTIVRDITQRKKSQAKLEQTMQALIESNEDLERFAYVASHDLKSPLRAIDNLSLWLQEDAGPELDDDNKERLSLIRGRILRMEGLLNSLMAYSRADEKIMETKLMSATHLLNEIIEVQNVPKGFEIQIDGSLDAIMIPRMPLEQVFHNLMSNAIKHHDKDKGIIKLSGMETAKTLKFIISDDGPGIAPRFHGKIFEIFQTLKSRDDVEGSGMGLALVKKILYRQNGKIEIDSDIGKGTTFTITWPKRSFFNQKHPV